MKIYNEIALRDFEFWGEAAGVNRALGRKRLPGFFPAG